MDDDDEQPKSKAKTTLYLACFGFSGKLQVSQKKSVKILQTDHKHNWFSWSTTFPLKQSGNDTLPAEYTMSEKLQIQKAKLKKSKPRRNSSDEIPSKREKPISKNKIPASYEVYTTSDEASEDRAQETKHGSKQNIIPENGRLLDHVVDSPKQLSSSRQIEGTRISSKPPSSPKPKSHGAAVLRSTSLPAPNRSEKSILNSKRLREANEVMDNKLDPVTGMSIVMATLIVMLLWGRLCAILCTCAWLLYLVPRLTAKVKSTRNGTLKNGMVSYEPDFNSEEYKKRVVLEGFLERNHRSTP